jgi:hypothetical protein
MPRIPFPPGATATAGISLNSGDLQIENSSFSKPEFALIVNNSLATVVNCNFVGNNTAVSTVGTGVDGQVFPLTGTTWVAIFGGAFTYNIEVFAMTNPGLRPSPATDNRTTIFVSSPSSSPPILIAGNLQTVVGFGAGCNASNCQSFTTLITQTGNSNLN